MKDPLGRQDKSHEYGHEGRATEVIDGS